MEKRNNFYDSIRALAVMPVVFTHDRVWPPGGSNGVSSAARLLRLSVFVWLLFAILATVTNVATNFHIDMYGRNESITLIVLLTSLIGLAFHFARFSFGYLVGFYLYAMMAGYFWFNTFGTLGYDRRTALISSSASIILFLIPSLLITGPATKRFTLPRWAMDALPLWIFSLLALVLVLATPNEFRIVAPSEMYDHRDALQQSRIIGYALGNYTGALIPFAFACFVARRQWFALSLLGGLSLLFFTVTITKFSLVLPFYLGFIAILASRYEARSVVILSLLIPIVVALVLRDFDSRITNAIWGFVALRLVAIPSITLDHYFVFFTDNPLTYFCQINLVKALTDCPYKEQLGVVLQNWFRLGNMNGSLFATEGVASVGPLYAPMVAFICGSVIAIGNKVSADLPKSFILTSAAVIPQILLNVPLTTALLSNGLGLLFGLWYVTPTGYFSAAPPPGREVIEMRRETEKSRPPSRIDWKQVLTAIVTLPVIVPMIAIVFLCRILLVEPLRAALGLLRRAPPN
jgi:hypothetical protein